MKKILIVDDEPDICEGIASFLTDAGYQTSVATRGQEAFDKIIQEKPDLAILDIALPDLDGTVLYENLRKNPAAQGTRIMFLTALASGAPDQLQGIDRDDYTILAKPVKFEALEAEIRRLLEL